MERVRSVFMNFLEKIKKEKNSKNGLSDETITSIYLFNELLQKPENSKKILQTKTTEDPLSNYSIIFDFALDDKIAMCLIEKENMKLIFNTKCNKLKNEILPLLIDFFTKRENLILFDEVETILTNNFENFYYLK